MITGAEGLALAFQDAGVSDETLGLSCWELLHYKHARKELSDCVGSQPLQVNFFFRFNTRLRSVLPTGTLWRGGQFVLSRLDGAGVSLISRENVFSGISACPLRKSPEPNWTAFGCPNADVGK